MKEATQRTAVANGKKCNEKTWLTNLAKKFNFNTIVVNFLPLERLYRNLKEK